MVLAEGTINNQVRVWVLTETNVAFLNLKTLSEIVTVLLHLMDQPMKMCLSFLWTNLPFLMLMVKLGVWQQPTDSTVFGLSAQEKALQSSIP